MDEIETYIKNICKSYPNVTYLNNDTIDFGDCRVIGSILWSYVPTRHLIDVSHSLNDYRFIYKGDVRTLQVSDVNKMFAKNLHFVQQNVDAAKSDGKKCVVLSHHAPIYHGSSHPMHNGSPIQCAFATDLTEYMIVNGWIDVWCCGHTHYNFDVRVGNTRVVTNQYGYGKEPEKGYNKALVIEV